jgi:hypothetical protein
MTIQTAVKTSNFGPHGNVGTLFQKGLPSSNEENKGCRKTLDLQIRFRSLLVNDSSKKATELAKKKKLQSFHEVQS